MCTWRISQEVGTLGTYICSGARPKSKLKIRTVYGPLINRLARETAAAPLDETVVPSLNDDLDHPFKIQHWNMSRLLIIAARAGNNITVYHEKITCNLRLENLNNIPNYIPGISALKSQSRLLVYGVSVRYILHA